MKKEEKERIICGRPLSPRELAWSLLAAIAFIVAGATLFRYPILALATFCISVVALGRSGFFRGPQQKIRNFLGYRLY